MNDRVELTANTAVTFTFDDWYRCRHAFDESKLPSIALSVGSSMLHNNGSCGNHTRNHKLVDRPA